RKLFRISGPQAATHRRHPQKWGALRVEALEDRLAPAVSVVDGDISITGVPGNDVVFVRFDGSASTYKVAQNNVTSTIPSALVTGGDIIFAGGDGNDRFENLIALRAVARGEGGNDTLVGCVGNDTLEGGLGEDYLFGNGGSDRLYANAAAPGATDYGYN